MGEALTASHSVIDRKLRHQRGTHGVQYLIDAIASVVATRLTAAYRDALLRRAGDASDLDTALIRLAQQKGAAWLPNNFTG